MERHEYEWNYDETDWPTRNLVRTNADIPPATSNPGSHQQKATFGDNPTYQS